MAGRLQNSKKIFQQWTLWNVQSLYAYWSFSDCRKGEHGYPQGSWSAVLTFRMIAEVSGGRNRELSQDRFRKNCSSNSRSARHRVTGKRWCDGVSLGQILVPALRVTGRDHRSAGCGGGDRTQTYAAATAEHNGSSATRGLPGATAMFFLGTPATAREGTRHRRRPGRPPRPYEV